MNKSLLKNEFLKFAKRDPIIRKKLITFLKKQAASNETLYQIANKMVQEFSNDLAFQLNRLFKAKGWEVEKGFSKDHFRAISPEGRKKEFSWEIGGNDDAIFILELVINFNKYHHVDSSDLTLQQLASTVFQIIERI